MIGRSNRANGITWRFCSVRSPGQGNAPVNYATRKRRRAVLTKTRYVCKEEVVEAGAVPDARAARKRDPPAVGNATDIGATHSICGFLLHLALSLFRCRRFRSPIVADIIPNIQTPKPRTPHPSPIMPNRRRAALPLPLRPVAVVAGEADDPSVGNAERAKIAVARGEVCAKGSSLAHSRFLQRRIPLLLDARA